MEDDECPIILKVLVSKVEYWFKPLLGILVPNGHRRNRIGDSGNWETLR